ncbi:cytochrome b N-terminal domain-containing protein [Aquihabitans sp. McL0605]|uniref:cytochrome b N-terminal domain-containing protein n=1 Tax=Aquihabitans sp. McL0605 TaxID=3415671 RepID=UPI003CF244F4
MTAMAEAAARPTEAGSEANDRLRAVRRALVWALTAEVALLALTGVYLAFFYRPTASQAWNDIYQLHASVTTATRVRTVHRWTAWAAISTAVPLGGVLLGEGVARWHGPDRRRRGVATGPLVVLGILVAAYLGTLLPWDQLALWAVTVGTDMAGYRPLFDDKVRFVIVNGSQVGTATVLTVLLLHAIVVPGLVLGLLGLSSARDRRGPRAPDQSEG